MAKKSEEVRDTAAGIPIPDGYVEQQTGLPPYWGPNEEQLKNGVAQYFHAKVIMFDNKDPKFERWVLQALAPITCFRGKREQAEQVDIKPGEFFSISDYAGLPLGRYMGHPVFVYAKNKRPISGGQEVWEWGLRTSPEVARLVQERYEQMIAAAQKSGALQGKPVTPKALPESDASRTLPAT